MTTVRRHETATVPENSVELYRDVYLPSGKYPVIAEYTIIPLHALTEKRWKGVALLHQG